jgi:hypothetical protein
MSVIGEENMKETSEAPNYVNQVKEALKNVKGPVKHHDLTKEPMPDTDDYEDATMPDSASPMPEAVPPPEAPAVAAAPAAAAPEPAAPAPAPAYVPAPAADTAEQAHVRRVAMQDYARARKLDGLPELTAKRPRMSFGELDPMAHVAMPVPDDDSLWVDDYEGDEAHVTTTGEGPSQTSRPPAVPLRRWDMLDVTLGGYMDVDEMVLLFESEECVYMAKGNDIVEARLQA